MTLDSVESEAKGVELFRELDELWGIAGMKARKWLSNSSEVIAAIPEADRATDLKISQSQDPTVKTLGVSWNSIKDTFSVSTSLANQDSPQTKRTILKRIATVFDPLGFVSPYVMLAKVILQELWARGCDWDDIIEDELAARVDSWFKQLNDLGEVQVPRCLQEAKKVVSKSIVTFTDASVQAYGAVAYLRCEYEDGEVTARMITSKSKVAPLKPMTVPRLELMGAILGLRLAENVTRILQMSLKTAIFYSDSMDVLWWIRGRDKSTQRKIT